MDNIEVKELTRFQSVQDRWAEIEKFIAFLDENNIVLAERYGPERIIRATAPLKTMLSDFYEIDLIEVAREKELIVEEFMSTIA